MSMDYDYRSIEAAAQADWNSKDVYRVTEDAVIDFVVPSHGFWGCFIGVMEFYCWNG